MKQIAYIILLTGCLMMAGCKPQVRGGNCACGSACTCTANMKNENCACATCACTGR